MAYSELGGKPGASRDGFWTLLSACGLALAAAAVMPLFRGQAGTRERAESKTGRIGPASRPSSDLSPARAGSEQDDRRAAPSRTVVAALPAKPRMIRDGGAPAPGPVAGDHYLMPIRSADSVASSKTLADLTRREREVAPLVARGLTNRQIAEELVITERTAETHVCNILNKLGFSSRTQLAAWVVEQSSQRVVPMRPALPQRAPLASAI